MVKTIATHDEFKKLLADNKDKVVVVDFYADWCGPCKFISPKFEEHAGNDKYSDKFVFVKVDVDNNEDTAMACEIQAMPTFHFYHQEKKVDEFMGANAAKLEELLDKHNA